MSKRLLVLLIVVVALALVGAGGNDGRTFEAELRGENEVPNPVVTDTKGKAELKVNRSETAIAFKVKIKQADGILGRDTVSK